LGGRPGPRFAGTGTTVSGGSGWGVGMGIRGGKGCFLGRPGPRFAATSALVGRGREEGRGGGGGTRGCFLGRPRPRFGTTVISGGWGEGGRFGKEEKEPLGGRPGPRFTAT
jgi:hypothetical protein